MLQEIFMPFKQKAEPRKFNYKARYYNQINNDIRRKKILEGEEDIEVSFADRFHKKVMENRKKRGNLISKILILLLLLVALLLFISFLNFCLTR